MESSRGVLHLGAHHGQEADTYAAAQKPVVWVEAVPQYFEQLRSNIRSYPEQQALLGLLDRETGAARSFKISNNAGGVSSSIFSFGEYASGKDSLWPDLNLHMVDDIELVSITLDKLLSQHSIAGESVDFWVVDLQGAELLALEGADEYLKFCRYLMVEVSTVEVYRAGPLWPEVERFLNGKGFRAMWNPAIPHDNILFAR